MTQLYNQFNTYQEGLLPAILDTMEWLRNKKVTDESGRYIPSITGTNNPHDEIDAHYQSYLDGNITEAEVLTLYGQYQAQMHGKWADLREAPDGKFYYETYPYSLNTYTTVSTNPFLIEEE